MPYYLNMVIDLERQLSEANETIRKQAKSIAYLRNRETSLGIENSNLTQWIIGATDKIEKLEVALNIAYEWMQNYENEGLCTCDYNNCLCGAKRLSRDVVMVRKLLSHASDC